MSSVARKTGTTRLDAVDAYIARTRPFAQPVLAHIRELVHEGAPGVTEAIKWSMPFFVYDGVILGNMAAFKEHCSFGLWGAPVVAEMRADGTASGGSMGSFGRITAIDDLPPRKQLLGYVQKAAKAIATGARTKAWERPKVAKPAPQTPASLSAALKKDKAAAKAWAALPPGCQREYADWIASAKREETVARRVAQTVAQVAEGKRINWKYETK